MKTKTWIFAILLAAGLTSGRAQDTWTQKADFGGIERYGAVGFSIGNKGYIGIGYHIGVEKDFWEYDPATNTWTQKADFGGTAREQGVGFSIAGKGYIGTGSATNGLSNDFWEYDPITNAWTQKANFAGTARWLATGFSIGSKGYIGTGRDASQSLYKDFWEYDPSTDAWTQKADFGGLARQHAAGFSIGTKGYIGTGDTHIDDTGDTNDFWEYDPVTDTWTQKANFGTARGSAVGFSIGSNGYIGTGSENNITLDKDFWEYDPSTDAWTQKADFGGVARQVAAGFSIGSKGYIGTGLSQTQIGYQKDFWEYTPATAQTPPARSGMGMAYDAAREQVVLFGGGVDCCSGNFFNDTWVWDGTTWTQVFPVTSPPARTNIRLAFDAQRGEVVLFGGRGDTAELNDTWTWDGTTWTEQHPSTVPPIRDEPGLAYDAQRGKVVMFGGYQGCFHCNPDDTWTWDGVTWTQESPTRSPSGRDSMGMVYDALQGEVVLFGGVFFPTTYNDTWTWDGSNWQRESPPASPPARAYLAMAYDEVRGEAVMFGGNNIPTYLNDTWVWDGTTWAQRFPATSPSARALPGMTYDAARGRVVLFGGQEADGTPLGDTWTWDGTTWLLQAATVALSETSLKFGVQLVGTTSAAQRATLTNTGTTTLTISSIAASGDFIAENNCGPSVPAGASCTIRVAFNPSAKGVRTGRVTITDDATNSPQIIKLKGTGTVVQVSPSVLDFGHQIVGTTSDPQTATVTNISSEDLHISGIGFGGANFGDFAETTTCGSRLVAGGSCTIDVTFTPGARGDRHASLKIVDDGGASPQAVPLAGTGIPR